MLQSAIDDDTVAFVPSLQLVVESSAETRLVLWRLRERAETALSLRTVDRPLESCLLLLLRPGPWFESAETRPGSGRGDMGEASRTRAALTTGHGMHGDWFVRGPRERIRTFLVNGLVVPTTMIPAESKKQIIVGVRMFVCVWEESDRDWGFPTLRSIVVVNPGHPRVP